MYNPILAVLLSISAVAQPQNASCANSEFATGSIVTAPTGKTAIVTRVATISNANVGVVGWVYDTNLGDRLAQALPIMSGHDREIGHLSLGQNDTISGLVGFPESGNPWSSLILHYCMPAEMQFTKFSPWKRPTAKGYAAPP